MKKMVVGIGVLLCLLLWFSSCGTRIDDAEQPAGTDLLEEEKELVEEGDNYIVVGISQVGSESDWRIACTESLKSTFTQENGYYLIFEDAQQKQENQLKTMRDFILQEVDYIILDPIVETGWDAVLKEAKDAGIPVILVDRQVKVSDENLYTAWVGSDFHSQGVKAGRWLENYLEEQGRGRDKIRIVTLQGTLNSTAQLGRTDGFASVMEEHDNYAVDFIRATGWIRRNLPGSHVSGGVSNLSFSFRGNNYIREAMHAVFLYHAIREGMDMGIVNPASSVLYTDIPADVLERIEDVVLNRRPDAAERLIETAERLKAEKEAEKASGASASSSAQQAWRSGTLEERLTYALTKGIADYLEEDLAEALNNYPKAVDIIEGPLMAGMNHVGDLFGAGKMFLPQVVKTARTMKKAVAILQPAIEAEKPEGMASAGRVLLATVKGDVHDIGKNIVSVVMACNGYEVIDLGVMVPAEVIVQRAKAEKVDMIGLSGLITPSLDEMVHVASELEKAGLDIPLLIGGATTSALHTALKIVPVYHAPVVHLKDASQNATVAARLMNPRLKEEFVQELNREQASLLAGSGSKQADPISIEQARENRLDLFGGK